MELQLGLGLGVSPSINKFETASCCWEPDKASFGSPHSDHDEHHYKLNFQNKKRSFDEAFGNNDDDFATSSVEVPQTLTLFSMDHHDEVHEDEYESSSTINERIDDEGFEINSAIGWPPIKPCRKKFWQYSNSLYVKVKMEGVGIARKIDISKYESYQTLANTLVDMFGKSEEDMRDYKLTYQDKEGDWLLVGDLPWKSFIMSVQCLKWIRNVD